MDGQKQQSGSSKSKDGAASSSAAKQTPVTDHKEVDKSKDKSKSKSKNTSNNDDSLAQIMTSGFANLELLFTKFMSQCEEQEEAYVEPENTEPVTENDEEHTTDDIFAELLDKASVEDKVGPDISHPLATLADKLLKTKLSESDAKEKEQIYARPKNVEFLEAPKVNKAIWENMAGSKLEDLHLQNVQKIFVVSSGACFEGDGGNE